MANVHIPLPADAVDVLPADAIFDHRPACADRLKVHS
jgi:hypothetical protein